MLQSDHTGQAACAFDGNDATYWATEHRRAQWADGKEVTVSIAGPLMCAVEGYASFVQYEMMLGGRFHIRRVELSWKFGGPSSYVLQLSQWTGEPPSLIAAHIPSTRRVGDKGKHFPGYGQLYAIYSNNLCGSRLRTKLEVVRRQVSGSSGRLWPPSWTFPRGSKRLCYSVQMDSAKSLEPSNSYSKLRMAVIN